MSGEGLAYCEDAGTRPQSDRVRTRGESIVELAETGDRSRAVAARYGSERLVELGAHVQPVSERAKLDDRDAHRQRSHELRTLQRLSSHSGFRIIQKIATIHASSGVIWVSRLIDLPLREVR
jgi:hypothetical protein